MFRLENEIAEFESKAFRCTMLILLNAIGQGVKHFRQLQLVNWTKISMHAIEKTLEAGKSIPIRHE